MSVLGNEDLPVTGTADVLKEFPREVRNADVATVRDAIVAGITAMFQEFQDRAEYAALQSDIVTATDIYLEGLGDDHELPKLSGETETDYRTRILSTPELVTPTAIIDAVLNIIASYTPIQPQYMEASLDRWYVSAGDAVWHSFIEAGPQYQDRLYPDDVLTNGVERANSDPGYAWVFSDEVGRYFVLRIPNLSSSDTQHAFISTGSGSFINDGTNPSGSESNGLVATFMFGPRQLATQLYAAIVGAIDKIKGHSIRWQLLVDSRLK